jgi:hypothetical protein
MQGQLVFGVARGELTWEVTLTGQGPFVSDVASF